MAEISLWDLDVPAPGGAGSDDDADYTLGTIFYVTEDTEVDRIAFYIGSAATVYDRAVALYVNGNTTAVASGPGVAIQTGWTVAPLTPPYTCVVGVQYIAAFNVPAIEPTVGYWAEASYNFGPVARGPFVGVVDSADTEGVGNGRFATAMGTYPGSSFNLTNYWATPVSTEGGFMALPASELGRNDDSLLAYLKANFVIASGEVVGALNEYNGVTAAPRKEYQEARRTAFGL